MFEEEVELLDCSMTSPGIRPCLFIAAIATVIVQALVTETTVQAQTLTNPTPQPRATATSTPPESKPCPAYGPGFVQLPGTNTCVKIGGSVQVQGASNAR
jgi:hypothetical protein